MYMNESHKLSNFEQFITSPNMAKPLCGLNYSLSLSTILLSFIVLAYEKQDREKKSPHP